MKRNRQEESPEQEAQRKLEKSRKDWQQAQKGLTREEALTFTSEYLKGAGIRGRSVNVSSCGEYVRMEVERAWTLSASLYVNLRRNLRDDIQNPDNRKQYIAYYDVRVEVGWGSTIKNIVQSTAAIALYRELVELGAEIEVILDEKKIYEFYDFSKEEEAS